MHTRLKRVGRRFGVEISQFRNSTDYRRRHLLQRLGVTTMFDIGANTGQYALGLRASGWAGRIVSVEPVPAAYAALVKAAANDRGWEPVHAAVADEPGELVIQVSADTQFSSALPLTELAANANRASRVVGTASVEAVTLDDLVSRRDGPFGVKVDVQGFERQVFSGGVTALREASYVEVEMSPQAVYEGQMLMDETIDLMRSNGLVLSLVQDVFWDERTGRALQFNGMFARA